MYNQPTRPCQVLVPCGGGRPTPEPPGCTPSLLLTPSFVVHSPRQLLLQSEPSRALSKSGLSNASLAAGGSDDESLGSSPIPPPASVLHPGSATLDPFTTRKPHRSDLGGPPASGVFFPPISSAILPLRKVKSLRRSETPSRRRNPARTRHLCTLTRSKNSSPQALDGRTSLTTTV